VTVTITTSVQWGKSKESGANAGRKHFHQPSNGVTQVDIVDDTCPQRFHRSILKVQRYTHIILFRSKGECLRPLARFAIHKENDRDLP
jgi:hypothetical protein